MSANVQQLRAVRAETPGATTATGATVRSNPVIAALRRLAQRLLVAHKRRVAIDELSRLDDRQLADIGLRREQIPELVYRQLHR